MILGNKQLLKPTFTEYGYKYIRIQGYDAAGTSLSSLRLGVSDFRLYSGANQTGSVEPSTNLTSSTSQAGLVTSEGYAFTDRPAWKAADGLYYNFWWSLSGTVAEDNWMQFYFENGIGFDIASLHIVTEYCSSSTQRAKVLASDTGAFAGEEVILATLTGFTTNEILATFDINVDENAIDYPSIDYGPQFSIRLQVVDLNGNPTANYIGIREVEIFTLANQAGTSYPSTMTQDDMGSGLLASAGYSYSATYAPYTAFDDFLASLWWSINGTVAADNWLQIQIPDISSVASMRVVQTYSLSATSQIKVYKSATGDFTGEEVLIATLTNPSTDATSKTYNFNT